MVDNYDPDIDLDLDDPWPDDYYPDDVDEEDDYPDAITGDEEQPERGAGSP
jgi:hypothetical protein